MSERDVATSLPGALGTRLRDVVVVAVVVVVVFVVVELAQKLFLILFFVNSKNNLCSLLFRMDGVLSL